MPSSTHSEGQASLHKIWKDYLMTTNNEDLIAEARRWANGHPNRRSGELMRDLADALAALTEEYERTKRGAKTLGEMIKRQCDDIVKITDSQHLIDETGDGDWGLVWERGFDMRDRLAALTTRQEIDAPSVREAIGEVLADMEAVIDGVPVASDLVALTEIADAAIRAATSPPSRTAKRTGYETVASAVGEHSQKITARAALERAAEIARSGR